MNPENEFEKLEHALIRAGKTMAYPATPALSVRVRAELTPRRVRRWRPAFALLAAILFALALLLAFPQTRDALAQILGLRTIQIIPTTPTPTLLAPTRESIAPPTPTVRMQCCETTLADARARSRFRILLPPAPAPSRVYLQNLPGYGVTAQQVILIFGDPGAPQFTLYQATNFLYGKMVGGGTVIAETRVKGQRALWLTGAPHLLIFSDARGNLQMDSARAVDANTLAWEIGDITYRLETPASQAEAIQFAESLQ